MQGRPHGQTGLPETDGRKDCAPTPALMAPGPRAGHTASPPAGQPSRCSPQLPGLSWQALGTRGAQEVQLQPQAPGPGMSLRGTQSHRKRVTERCSSRSTRKRGRWALKMVRKIKSGQKVERGCSALCAVAGLAPRSARATFPGAEVAIRSCPGWPWGQGRGTRNSTAQSRQEPETAQHSPCRPD